MTHKRASTKKDNFSELKNRIEKAKNEQKVFILRIERNVEHYNDLRNSLVNRGWVEKLERKNKSYVVRNSDKDVVAWLLKDSPPDFIWQPKFRPIPRYAARPPFMNSLKRSMQFDYTQKDGLKNCIDAIGWYHDEGTAELCYIPRTFVLDDQEAKKEFEKEYENTAFKSFINFLNDQEDLSQLFSADGSISSHCIEFAIMKVKLMIKVKEHVDIDMSKIFTKCYDHPKNQNLFLNQIEHIINGSKKFVLESQDFINAWKKKIKRCAEDIAYYWPDSKYDGFRNIWIFKPPDYAEGYGILVHNDDQSISKILWNSNQVYVAQKYIEKPLLVHGRKFDMRIFILTLVLNETFHVWLYKDCYTKFAVVPFTLNEFDRKIHLTNYIVQQNFMNAYNAVPNSIDGMWRLKELKNYFASIGKPKIWESKIYPAVKKGLLAAILPGLVETTVEHKAFELHGADVMITYDYEPAIIEINRTPGIYGWQHQEKTITRQLIDDLVKVVVDHTKDKAASTGEFELIYSIEIPRTDFEVSNMEVIGSKFGTE